MVHMERLRMTTKWLTRAGLQTHRTNVRHWYFSQALQRHLLTTMVVVRPDRVT